MATVRGDGRALTIELTRWEGLFVGNRRRLVVPLTSLAGAERVDRPTRFAATPGGRSGLAITGVLKIGRWGIGTGTRRLVVVRRWVPALSVALTPEGADQLGYDTVLISTRDVDTLLADLVQEAGRPTA